MRDDAKDWICISRRTGVSPRHHTFPADGEQHIITIPALDGGLSVFRQF